MEYIVIAFRSRGHTVKFYQLLQENRIGAQIINTPKEAGVGCGLSVKIMPTQIINAKTLLNKSALSSFAGLFMVKEFSSSRLVRVIN